MRIASFERKGTPSFGIVVGEGVNVPVRLTMDDLAEEFRPRSGSAKFAAAWTQDTAPQGFVEATVERWRRQQRES